MADEGKRCAFCGSREKLTSEHVMGDWIKQHLSPTMNKHRQSVVTMSEPGKLNNREVRIRAGDPLNSQVGILCRSCNSERLGPIQERAQPPLAPLFRGESQTLDASARSIISAWLAMLTMTGEYMMLPPRIAVPQVDRDWLRTTRTAPRHWRIWIGHCEEWLPEKSWFKTTLAFLDPEDLPKVVSGENYPANTQTTAMKFGKLFAFTMSSIFPEIVANWDWLPTPRAKLCLQQIWPDPGWDVVWPFCRMSSGDAKDFAVSFVAYWDTEAARDGYIPRP
jgi:hypothetical protein